MAPIHPRSSSPSKAPSANRSESVTNELTSSIASGIVCHADGMCAMASMRMRAACPSTSSVSSRKFRMRVFTGPASPRVAAPAAIGPAQSCDPISCVLSVHPLSLNSRWPAVYPILTQWALGRVGVFGLNFGAVRLEPWYEPGRTDRFQNVEGLLTGALQFMGDAEEVGRLLPFSRRSKRQIVGRIELEAPHSETLRRSCASK